MAEPVKKIVKPKVKPVKAEAKEIKTKIVVNRRECRGNADIFCKQAGIATIKVEMPDGSTHTLMTINTEAGNNNVSLIRIRAKALPISKDRVTVED